jgi:ribA/ribD-fused uncharacterized protein
MDINSSNFIGFYGHQMGSYRCFSNFYPSQFIENNIVYNCAEQYIMAKKALLFNDNDIYQSIMKAQFPVTIKHLGRLVRNYNDTIWKENREFIAKQCLYLKFSQNTDIKKILLKTADKYIAECAPRDRIWGIGFGIVKALKMQDKWGENLLGKTLMYVREQLKVR